MSTETLSTPCLLIDRPRLLANLEAMQRKATANQVALRPHTKTHKSVDLGRMQLDMGASGITVAKIGEAEVYAKAGFSDIRIAYEVIGDDKYARIADLMQHISISFCVDTIEGANAASAYFSGNELTADILVEIDAGYGRCGVLWNRDDSIDFVRTVSEMPGLNLKGILTHAGHAYNGPQDESESKEDALRRVSNEERDRMLSFANALSDAGLVQAGSGFEISVGSTPSMRYFENREDRGFTVTEIRPGNYVFNDRIQVAIDVAGWDTCALTVLATVISRHRDADGSERLFLDAGRKVLTSDLGKLLEGYGAIMYNPRTMEPLPHARITGLSEEHGWVQVHGGSTLSVGDRVRVVPNHACVVVNTQRRLYVVDGDEIVDTWSVDAQSKVA